METKTLQDASRNLEMLLPTKSVNISRLDEAVE